MNNTLGKFIREKRGDLSLRDFAAKCDLSHTMVDILEKGYDPRTGKPARPTLDTLEKVANGLRMSLGELMCQAEIPGFIEIKKTVTFNDNQTAYEQAKALLPPEDKDLIDIARRLKAENKSSSVLPPLTPKDEREIAKDLENMINLLDDKNGMAAYNDPEDEEDRELLKASLLTSMRLAKQIAKKKYTPKKYRKE